MFNRYRQQLSPTLKYWVFLLGIIGIIFVVIFGSFIASYLSLELADRALVAELFAKLAAILPLSISTVRAGQGYYPCGPER